MKDAKETGNKIFRFVQGEKEIFNDIGNGLEEAVKEAAVFKEKGAEEIINGEDAVPVPGMDQFGSHFEGACHGIFCPAGRAKTGMAVEGNMFKITAVRTGIHGTAEGRVTTVNHFIDIFHLSFSGMKSIFNFFIMVGKNFL